MVKRTALKRLWLSACAGPNPVPRIMGRKIPELYQSYFEGDLQKLLPPEFISRIRATYNKEVIRKEMEFSSTVRRTDLLTKVSLDQTPSYDGPFMNPDLFGNKGYWEYRDLATSFWENIMQKRRRFKGHKWNPLGIRLINHYYKGDILVIEPLYPQTEIDFSKDSFLVDIASHLEIIASEAGSDASFTIDCKTSSENGRVPCVYVKGDDFEGAAFLAAYYAQLMQDLIRPRAKNASI